MTSKYGSDNVEKSLTVQRASLEDADSLEAKKISNVPGSESKDDSGSFRKKDLSPLVIHKQMSGENIENTGVVHVEKDENNQLDVANDYVEKSPLQDYLKLVTVTPSEDEVKSPKTPMSPRELFFIDLIREAEKAENAKKSLKRKTHFFPDETSESDAKNVEDVEEGKDVKRTKNVDGKDPKDVKNIENGKDLKDVKNTEDGKDAKDVKNIEDGKDVKDAKNIEDGDAKDPKEKTKDEKINEEKLKRESSYFIADVENAVCEKTEICLQIDSDVDEQIELIVEKPALTLQSKEANSQETFIPQADSITKDD